MFQMAILRTRCPDVSQPESGQYDGTNLEKQAAPGSAAPERLQEAGWAGGLPDTAGLWTESDPAGSSSDQLSLHEKTV